MNLFKLLCSVLLVTGCASSPPIDLPTEPRVITQANAADHMDCAAFYQIAPDFNSVGLDSTILKVFQNRYDDHLTVASILVGQSNDITPFKQSIKKYMNIIPKVGRDKDVFGKYVAIKMIECNSMLEISKNDLKQLKPN